MASEFEKGDKIARIEKGLERPTAALKQIGALILSESQQSFRDQRFGTKSWDARGVPNVFGIIADFASGKKTPAARRFEARPVLRDTGRLAASLSFAVQGDAVEVGTKLPYAAVHQKGGKTQSETITESVQTALNAWLKTTGKDMKKRLGWLLNKKFRGTKLESVLPARPFVGLTNQTKQDVRELIGVEIVEAE